jgi:hypothetical protein
MKSLVATALAGVLALVASAMPAAAAQRGKWSVTVETSGGFAGFGRGNVTIWSNGRAVVELAHRPNAPAERCTVRLRAADLAAIQRALASLRAEAWDGKTLGTQASDAMSYALELDVQNGRRRTHATASWFDSSYDRLPPDLAALYRAVDAAWQAAAAKCNARPGR